MDLHITRIDKELPLPKYETPGACAFDVYARVETVIAPKSLGMIPTNLIVCTPPGFGLIIASRSGTPRKKGLLIPHGFGLIDQDYCGPADEILMQVYNFTDAPVTVARGERVGQGFVTPIERWDIVEIEASTDPALNRGGFGSTGH